MNDSLLSINVSDKVEEKGKFSYLSWAWAVAKLIQHDPGATWEVKRFPAVTEHGVVDGVMLPFLKTSGGVFVEVAVTSNGVTRSQIHPVMDNGNKPLTKPSATDINKSIMRCLTKAIALHGLGLNVYAGEDLPME